MTKKGKEVWKVEAQPRPERETNRAPASSFHLERPLAPVWQHSNLAGELHTVGGEARRAAGLVTTGTNTCSKRTRRDGITGPVTIE